MNPHELRNAVLQARPDSDYFSEEMLSFFGDTMENYGVRSHDDNIWELYRKTPVAYGLQKSVYFDKRTLEIVFPKDGKYD